MTLSRSLALLAVTLAGCFPNNSTDVDVPDPIALEQQTWASSLGINLAGMTRLSSGVYYADTQAGTGTTLSGLPTVRVYYSGYLANGTRFDSNVGAANPLSFRLSDLIQGWQVGMQGMKVGGKRRLVIPAALGYGSNGSPPVIPGNANLVFDIELVGIS